MTPVSLAFLESVAQTCNVAINDDYNGSQQEGAARFQFSHKDGLRYSTSEAYLHPAMDRDNLEVWSGATAHRLVFSKNVVTGVEVTVNGESRVVHADQEVILCAGAVGSPQLLMVSGIGPSAHLAEHNITVRADLPVGQNLHDHLFFPLSFLAPSAYHRGTALHMLKGMFSEFLFGGGWFGRSVFESVAFLKTDPSAPIPDMQLHSLPWAYPAPNQDAPGPPDVDKRPALTVQPTLIYPKSRGEVRLRSAQITDAPLIDPHYLEETADKEQLLAGIALTREIMANPAITSELRGELEPGPNYLNRKALISELPNRVCTVYHPVGTCRMGIGEHAVVDPQLRVYGIQGLRVADASIMPSITGGNTNAPSIMIGEKCASLIQSES